MQRLVLVLFVALVASASTATKSLSDWRSDMGTFRVAILSGRASTMSVAKAEPFRLALEEKLALSVELVPVRDFSAMIRMMMGSPPEYAVMSAYAYAAAANLCECLEPLVTAHTADGSSAVRSVILRSRGGPARIEDLAGKTVGMVGSDAAGLGDIAILELSARGFESGQNGFSIRSFDDGESAAAAFLSGEIDALAGWEFAGGASPLAPGTLRLLLARAGDDPGISRIWNSADVPLRVHAVRASLPAEAKTILRDLLAAMFESDPVAYDSIEPVFGGGFFAARPAQFGALQKLLAARGIKSRSQATPGAEGPTDEDSD